MAPNFGVYGIGTGCEGTLQAASFAETGLQQLAVLLDGEEVSYISKVKR